MLGNFKHIKKPEDRIRLTQVTKNNREIMTFNCFVRDPTSTTKEVFQ